jgi:outer membrane receptor protein involved in Fe transport
MLALGTGVTWAQSVNTGSITGTVSLPDGTRTADATVTLYGASLPGGSRVIVTDAKGRFVFLSIPTGTYTVATSLTGYNTDKINGIKITGGLTVPLDINLEIAAVTEVIVVTSEAPIIDTRSSTIDTTFNADLLKVVPTARNTFYDLTLAAAGMASVGADESFLPSASAYGSAASENIFLVDGVNTTNPRGAAWGSMVTVNYDTVQEVKVLALGSRAEYGSYSGAAVDVITKSGTNDFHGSAGYYTKVGGSGDNQGVFPECGSGSFICADNNDDLTTTIEDDWEANFTLGGPILKDKLWFYLGYDKLHTDTDTPIFVPMKEYRADLIDLKLTGAFGPNHRVNLGYHNESMSRGNESWGDTWDDTMVYKQNRDVDSLSFNYQWVVSDHDIFGIKYLGFKTDEDPTIPEGLDHPGYINWWKWIGQSVGVGGAFPFVEAQETQRTTLQVDFEHFAEDFLGTHDVKFGVQYTTANADWQGGYFHGFANFAYPYPDEDPDSDPADWSWNCDDPDECWGTPEDPGLGFYNIETHANPWLTVRESTSTGFFVDDQWVVSDRITLNLGLRYDLMTAKYGKGAVYELPETAADINNPTVLRTRQGTGNIYDFKTWSPRIGIAWDLTGDGKTVLRAHVGRYYAPMSVEALGRFGPDMDETTQIYQFFHVMYNDVDVNGDGVISQDEVAAATRSLHDMTPAWTEESTSDPSWDLRVAPGTGSPYTDQFNISIQRQLGRDFAAELSYVYKKTDNLISLWPYNRATGEDWQWEEIPYTTWTGNETNIYQIALEDFDGNGEIDFDDVQFIFNNTAYEARNMSDVAGKDASRTYEGVQLTFKKRYSHRWQALASFNWTDTDGVAPRTVDQNWYIDGPMVMDTPFGSTLNHFVNNLEGPMLMTPRFMFKLSGSYTIPVIETDLGFRVRYDDGRAIFPIETVPSYQSWDEEFQPGIIVGVGGDEKIVAGKEQWLPSTTIIDLSLNKTFEFKGDYGFNIAFDALNVLNEDSPNKVGYTEADYGRVYSLVNPRRYRLTLKFIW